MQSAQGEQRAATPLMGWMTWNFFADSLHEKAIREMADALVASGMVQAGYTLIMHDNGWQGGRDNHNNLIADPAKFPSGIKALADYVPGQGLRLGIYSDAALGTRAASVGKQENCPTAARQVVACTSRFQASYFAFGISAIENDL